MAKLIPIYTWNKGVMSFSRGSKRLSSQPWFQGVLLLACVIAAMLLANLPFTKHIYHEILLTNIQINLHSAEGSFNLLFPRDMNVEKFINDILMVIFFLLDFFCRVTFVVPAFLPFTFPLAEMVAIFLLATR